jgi:hypothetical protein
MPRTAHKPVYVPDEDPSSGFDPQPLHEGFGGIETRFFELGDQMSVPIDDTSVAMTWDGEQKAMRKWHAGWLLGVSAIVLGILLGVTAFVIHMMR